MRRNTRLSQNFVPTAWRQARIASGIGFGMLSMNDTSMVGCTKSIYDMVAVCGALQSPAAVNSPHTPTLAKAVADICSACQKQCEKFPNILECKACAHACESCTDECGKVAT